MDQRLTQEDIDTIQLTIQLDEAQRYSKKALNVLKRIKSRITEQPDRECFCSQLRRKIWYKEFINWYEGNS